MNEQQIELVRIIRDELEVNEDFGGEFVDNEYYEFIADIAREQGESLRLSKNEIDYVMENYDELVLTVE